jgi:hypothetical protein
MARVFVARGGVEAEQPAKGTTLPGDFLYAGSSTFIEIDERQHFTSFRPTSLDFYPDQVQLAFHVDEYRELCGLWSAKADRFRPTKDAIGFGLGGGQ